MMKPGEEEEEEEDWVVEGELREEERWELLVLESDVRVVARRVG